jgi:hypothetical protein
MHGTPPSAFARRPEYLAGEDDGHPVISLIVLQRSSSMHACASDATREMPGFAAPAGASGDGDATKPKTG